MLDRPASLAADTPLKSRPSRGPFRPEIWLNARERSSVRLSAHYFRLIDVLMVCGLAFSAVLAIQPTGLASITVGDAAPVVVGAVLVLELMRALQLYRFGRDTPWPLHMAGVVGVGVVSAGVALVLGWLLDRPALDVIAPWALTTTAALALLHGLWLVVIARWRRLGVLSPNIVIVGATRNARRLIEQALERRDMNVLGVFDDRLARSPESVAGVPVLGDAKALLTHRLTPYVDRIVLAIDPEAGQRVRDLTQTLNALPNPLTVLVDSELGRDGLLNRLANAPLASLDGPADPDRRAFNKRMQDLVIGAAALVVAAPIMSLVALAVKLDSRGPVFFRQRRHGFNHETIVVWKFRSMRQIGRAHV